MENSVQDAKEAANATVPEVSEALCCRVVRFISDFNLLAHNLIFLPRGDLICIKRQPLAKQPVAAKYHQGGSAYPWHFLFKYKGMQFT
jgi:hypothetical protein